MNCPQYALNQARGARMRAPDMFGNDGSRNRSLRGAPALKGRSLQYRNKQVSCDDTGAGR